MTFETMLVVGFAFGTGLGYLVQRSGLCFADGLGAVFAGRGRRILRLFLIVFAITSVGFLLSGYIDPALGLKPVGQIRGYGLYNLLAGGIFGAGILLAGGCILGTLRRIGEGNLTFLVVFASFIPGMALVVYVLDPLLEQGYHIQKPLLPELLHLSPPWVTGLAVLGSLAALWRMHARRVSGSGFRADRTETRADRTATGEARMLRPSPRVDQPASQGRHQS